jgi:HSP20 family molecular chaperone IbpA
MYQSLQYLLTTLQQASISDSNSHMFHVRISGMTNDDLSMQITPDRVMTIHGKEFNHSIYLPEDGDDEQISTAIQDKNILHIVVPKKITHHNEPTC